MPKHSAAAFSLRRVLFPIVLLLTLFRCGHPLDKPPHLDPSGVDASLPPASEEGGVVLPDGGLVKRADGSVSCTTTDPPVILTTPGAAFSVGSAHPRLWWQGNRLADAKTYYQSHKFTPDTPLEHCLSYLMTGNTSEARQAITWLLAETMDSSGNGDEARWEGENAILIYDWCHDQMTAAERQTIVDRWNGYIAAFNSHSWGGLDMPANNYFWGFLRNSLEWGIATRGENAMAEGFIDHALTKRWQQSFFPYTTTTGAGGVPEEGTQYGRYQLGYPMVAFATADWGGRSVLDENNFFKEALFYLIYSVTPSVTTRGGTASFDLFPFGSDEFWIDGDSGSSEYIGQVVATMAALWSDRSLRRYARHYLNSVKPKVPWFVAAADAGGMESGFSSLPLDYYAPGMGFFYLRNRWSPSATTLLLQLGWPLENMGHNHLDAGTFQLWRNGRYLSRETVAYSDDITGFDGGAAEAAKDMIGHNGVLFNGIGMQNNGYGGYQDGPPKVVRLETQSDYSYAAVDLSQIYRAHASGYPDRDENPYVANILREFVFIRPLETLVIFDRMRSSGEKVSAASVVKTQLIHFENRPTVDASGLLAIDGNQALRVKALLPATPSYRVISEGNAPIGQYRLELDTSGAADSYFLTVLQARDESGIDLTSSLAETSDLYTVTLQHPTLGRATIEFKKGMTSVDGRVGYSPTGIPVLAPLYNAVQHITVTDDGPSWRCTH